MEARIVNTPSAALDNEPARCFFAIELSKTSWLVAAQGPTGNVRCYQVTGCDANALLELIERIRARVKRETGRPVEMVSCYEAGYDGFWLHRFLVARGVRNCVIDPASLQVDRRARRAKTGPVDAGRVLTRLVRYTRGGPGCFSVARGPSVGGEGGNGVRLRRQRVGAEARQ